MEPVQIYEGRDPYIFVSYAHADSESVLPVLSELQSRGHRLWYDAGLVAGSEWPEYIAEHLQRASLVICFVSNAYIASANCRREMHYALSKHIPTLNIFLEKTRLTPGMEMQIGNCFALMKYDMSDRVFREKLYGAPLLQQSQMPSEHADVSEKNVQPPRKKNAPVQRRTGIRITLIIVCIAVLASLIALGVVGWSTGLARRLLIQTRVPEPVSLPGDTEAVFETEVLERAARAYTGIENGEIRVSDLAGLQELRLCGDRFWLSWEASETESGETEDGEGLRDLSDLAWFPDLNRLYLDEPSLESLSSLPLCSLEILELNNCRLRSLQGIGNAPLLRELRISGCPLRDLGDLQNCLQLRSISLMSGNVSDFSALHPLTKLAEFTVSGCGINELRTVFRMSRLTSVTLCDCDLRGSFFRVFDRERSIVSLSMVDCNLNSTENLNDFRGLTTLQLIRTGEILDWSELADLPALKTVYADKSMEETLTDILSGSRAELIIVGN